MVGVQSVSCKAGAQLTGWTSLFSIIVALGGRQFLTLLFHSFTLPTLQSNPICQAGFTIFQAQLDVKELRGVKSKNTYHLHMEIRI